MNDLSLDQLASVTGGAQPQAYRSYHRDCRCMLTGEAPAKIRLLKGGRAEIRTANGDVLGFRIDRK